MSTITRAIVTSDVTENVVLATATLLGKSVRVYCSERNADEFQSRKMKVDVLKPGQAPAILRNHIQMNFEGKETELLLLVTPLKPQNNVLEASVLETETVLRFGARNFDRVVCITNEEELTEIIPMILSDTISIRKRQALASGAFRLLSEHDSRTASFILSLMKDPQEIIYESEKAEDKPEDNSHDISKEKSEEIKISESVESEHPAEISDPMIHIEQKPKTDLHTKKTSLLDIDASLALDEEGKNVYRHETGESDVLFPDAYIPGSSDTVLNDDSDFEDVYNSFSENSSSEKDNSEQKLTENEFQPDFSVVRSRKTGLTIGLFGLFIIIGAIAYYWFGRDSDSEMNVSKEKNIVVTPKKEKTIGDSQINVKKQLPKVEKPKTVKKDNKQPVLSAGEGIPTENLLVKHALSKHRDDGIENSGCPQCVRDGLNALSRSKYSEAVKMFSYSISKKEEDSYTMALLSLAYHASKKDELALSTVEKVLKLNPENSWALLVAGSTWQLRGKYKKAIPYFEMFLKTADKKDPFYKDIERVLRRLK
ncbi:MAG: hypothetical protein JXR95_14875 [Deltaproteobacteria bacterium]|nr:hypothetical protein [Deltaproteobacteria bacterium]